MTKILCDVVPLSLFNKIKNIIESETFPWYYVPTTAYTGDLSSSVETLHNGSFHHTIHDNNALYECLEDYLLCAMDASEIKLNTLHRIRIGMIPVSARNTINPPHVDYPFPHSVALLYLNNADGNTFLYNEKYDTESKKDILTYYQEDLNSNVTVMTSVTPQENKLVLFDGLHYHSSSAPVTTKRRITVNYVFEGENI